MTEGRYGARAGDRWQPPATGYDQGMKALRVRVEHGRIVGEAPAGMPDGEFEVCLADDDEAMSDAEAASLNEALRRGFAAISAGRFRPATDVIANLRTR